MSEKELLSDPSFRNGFALLGINPAKDDRKVFRLFGNNPAWYLAEWWTPFPFKDAPLIRHENGYEMENESRRVAVDTADGALTMELNSEKEYAQLYHGVRTRVDQGWSHLLIEQNFKEPLLVSSLKGLQARIQFRVNQCTMFRSGEFNPQMHAAQLLWYITIREKPLKGDSGLGGNYIWFGLPLFDNRFPFEEPSAFYDIGNEGSTKKLIYGLGSKTYLPEAVVLGRDYSISVDILPEVKKAIAFAREHGIFQSDGDLFVNYMNLGWELPGNFAVSSLIKGLSIKGAL